MTLHPALRLLLKSLAFLVKAALVLACVSIWLAFVVLGIVLRKSRTQQHDRGVYHELRSMEVAFPPFIYGPMPPE
ncbi:hypothetical protein ELE36_03145 [Pseudolysobacter antarcticus]|uniref:Uncharacterized protein n=1 Tax=Pseudolysobacter antarcticus TaxID=2511995 RepID=A0A411HG79_9GAMM|nr:hypothetical protein [Pseudolysobacter antarcticus]QBB68891.1 hypothetical protein ELE36_00040 [Pseudolysobacter antarcticus]QBB69450.1 hypothetical protein ELE36_03145 [Pseudolysobacter antarcticus]